MFLVGKLVALLFAVALKLADHDAFLLALAVGGHLQQSTNVLGLQQPPGRSARDSWPLVSEQRLRARALRCAYGGAIAHPPRRAGRRRGGATASEGRGRPLLPLVGYAGRSARDYIAALAKAGAPAPAR